MVRLVLLISLTNTVLLNAWSQSLHAPSIIPSGGWVRSPSLVNITNHNSQGHIFYTTDGADPRDLFGQIHKSAQVATSPISINRSMVVRARVKLGTNWSELVAAPFTADQDFSKLIFTELMYHPRTGTNNGSEFEEFIEWKNVGEKPLDLSGLELRYNFSDQALGGLPVFKCPPGTVVLPGEFYVLARRTNVFQANYPGIPVAGELGIFLSNSEGSPMLRSPDGAIASIMAWHSHDPWPVVPDNHGYFGADPEVGFSLARATLDPRADSMHFSTWRASAYRYGSPGADDPEPTVPPVLINELLSRSTGGRVDSVELFNPNPTNVHVGGWWLSDKRNWPFEYMIPLGTTIVAEGFLVLDEFDFNSGTNNLSFGSDGERCYLFSGDANGQLTGYSHGFQFPSIGPNVSFGRNRLSDGSDVFIPESSLTLGEPNSGPWLAPLLVSEVYFLPEDLENSFLELKNTSNAPLPLWDPHRPQRTWSIGSSGYGIGYSPFFEFPTDVTIPPLGHVLLVQADPEGFRMEHQVPESVLIFQFPIHQTFAQSNNGLRIMRPVGTSPTDFRPRTQVMDDIIFANMWPWKDFISAGGQSLERIGFSRLGTEPTNWRLSPTCSSPGRDNSGNLAPQYVIQIPANIFPHHDSTLVVDIFDDFWPETALTSGWSQVRGPALVPIDSLDGRNATISFPELGQYEFEFTISDGFLTNRQEVVVQVRSNPYEQWRMEQFSSSESTNDAISGLMADPDGDRLSNVEEYFFATDPMSPEIQRPIQGSVVNGRLQLTWTQNLNARNVMASAEWADCITGPWHSGLGLLEREESPGSRTNSAIMKEKLLVPIADMPQQFIRFRMDW